jgi:hypothetical protein
MSPSEVAARYRHYAASSVDLAQGVLEPARKAALINMAQAWATLAENVEKNCGLSRPEGITVEEAEHRQ